MKIMTSVPKSDLFKKDGPTQEELDEERKYQEKRLKENQDINKKIEENFTKRKELTEKDIRDIEAFGPRLIVQLYVREEGSHALLNNGNKTSILLPSEILEMDKFTTCVGRLIKINSSCFKGERFKDWDVLPQLGDWVFFGRNNGTQLNYRGVSIVEIYDDFLLGRVSSPEDMRKD